MEVGGGSWGGEICGVMRAGSLGCLLCPGPAAFSSRDDVPAGVNGGECMAEAGEEGMEERCAECPEIVREAGLGEGACGVLAGWALVAACHGREFAYAGGWKRDRLE